jgi:hypothetical protein
MSGSTDKAGGLQALPVSDRARLGPRARKYYPSSSNAMRENGENEVFALYKTATGHFLTLPKTLSPPDVVSILVSRVLDA